jgi:hypothetical protein
VASVEGLDRLAAYPGVDAVSLSRPSRELLDWRKGSHEHVYSVLGTVPAHEDMGALQQFIADEVTVTHGSLASGTFPDAGVRDRVPTR